MYAFYELKEYMEAYGLEEVKPNDHQEMQGRLPGGNQDQRENICRRPENVGPSDPGSHNISD